MQFANADYSDSKQGPLLPRHLLLKLARTAVTCHKS